MSLCLRGLQYEQSRPTIVPLPHIGDITKAGDGNPLASPASVGTGLQIGVRLKQPEGE